MELIVVGTRWGFSASCHVQATSTWAVYMADKLNTRRRLGRFDSEFPDSVSNYLLVWFCPNMMNTATCKFSLETKHNLQT